MVGDSSGLVDQARRLAERVHAGQTDKAGQAYIGHVNRVARSVVPQEPVYVATAYLHDVVEDCGITLDDLGAQGLPVEVLNAVALLIRVEGVRAEEYYRRIRCNPIALAVKIADVGDNSDPQRLAMLDAPTRQRLKEKYRNALLALGQPALAASV